MDLTTLIITVVPVLALSLIGLWGLLKESKIKEEWPLTDGMVVEINVRFSKRAPVVSYRAEGEKYRQKSLFPTNFKCPYTIGEAVQVYYNPMQPKQFRIVGDKTPSLMWGIFLAMGVACAALTLVTLGLIAV